MKMPARTRDWIGAMTMSEKEKTMSGYSERRLALTAPIHLY